MDALIFLWAFYWPLLYIRIADSKLGITRLIVSFIVAAAVSYFGGHVYRYQVSQPASVLMTIFAALPIAILFLAGKPSGKRTQVKLIILAAYFHIFWQLLLGLSIYPFLLDIPVTLAVIALTKAKPKIRNRKRKPQAAISDIWK